MEYENDTKVAFKHEIHAYVNHFIRKGTKIIGLLAWDLIHGDFQNLVECFYFYKMNRYLGYKEQ